MDRQRDEWEEISTDMAVIMFSNNLIMPLPLESLIKINLPYRLAQIREGGVKSRILQLYLPSKEPDMQSDSIEVSLSTVAPVLVLLAAGNAIGLIILVIERCVHGDKFKTWSPRDIR
jgi:hypothetical protein